MKGLLLKEWYLIKAYCRMYLLIAAAFIALSVVNDENLFFVFYPCLLCGMIPVTLLGYDERSRFITYSATLPYTAAQLVSAKYIVGLLSQLAVLIATGVAVGVRMVINNTFSWHELFTLLPLILIVSSVSPAICLPFVFRYGVEKGRIAYYVMIGFVCAVSALTSSQFDILSLSASPTYAVLLLLSLAAVLLFLLSWYLSIIFYQKREL